MKCLCWMMGIVYEIEALDYCFAAGAKENQISLLTSLETLRNMVSANTGVTLIPELRHS